MSTVPQGLKNVSWSALGALLLPAILIVASVMLTHAVGAAVEEAEPAAPDAVEEPEDVETAERAQRDTLRAFYTAPPVIPHEATQMLNVECLHCHGEVREIGERVSVSTPHAQMVNCLQCHAASAPADGLPVEEVASSWEGLKAPERAEPAHEKAPSTMPHRMFMRENCTACHDMNSPYHSLRSPHTERTNCVQCHVPNASLEF
jgi:nitrate reductase cytochrome c-type subunit